MGRLKLRPRAPGWRRAHEQQRLQLQADIARQFLSRNRAKIIAIQTAVGLVLAGAGAGLALVLERVFR